MKCDENKNTIFCIDYKNINTVIKNGAETLHCIDSIFDQLSNAKHFSTLDLASDY